MEKKYLLMSLIVTGITLNIAGCKTVSSSVENIQKNIERSVDYGKDSVYIRDSVIVVRVSDTVFKERWRTQYVEHLVQKTDTVVQVDERVVESVVEKKVVPRWAWWSLGFLVLGFCILFVRAAKLACVKW